jgi:hypothetical protein
MGVRGSASRNGPSSTVWIFVSVATALAATLWLGNPCFAQDSYLLGHSEISAAANRRELAPWFSDDEVGDAGALVEWVSRVELRWARPAPIGEFSLTCHVDRKGDEFRHGQVQAVWLVRF